MFHPTNALQVMQTATKAVGVQLLSGTPLNQSKLWQSLRPTYLRQKQDPSLGSLLQAVLNYRVKKLLLGNYEITLQDTEKSQTQDIRLGAYNLKIPAQFAQSSTLKRHMGEAS